jgi:antitoxin PrlF
MGMTVRVGPKGQVVIPKAIRDRIGLHPGDEVAVALRDEEVVVVAVKGPRPLAGRFAGSGMAARLLEDRAAEPR